MSDAAIAIGRAPKRRRTTPRSTSYGVLLYRYNDTALTPSTAPKTDEDDKTTPTCSRNNENGEIQYLLGLIPQRNWWTVFKGLPEPDDESPFDTARREFAEETGTQDQSLLPTLSPVTTLYGQAGKKDLEIYLQNGSHISTDCFCRDRVVPIDQGYMRGQPEIVQIRWLTLRQALDGVSVRIDDKDSATTTRIAKLYTSQVKILRDAQAFLLEQNVPTPSNGVIA